MTGFGLHFPVNLIPEIVQSCSLTIYYSTCRWRKLFISKYGKFITDTSYYRKIAPTQWKEIYTLHSNWLSGHCHVQSLVQEKTSTPVAYPHENTKVTCLKISNCGSNMLASVHENSKKVHLWNLSQRRKLHCVQTDGVIGCIDFGSEFSRSILVIGQFNNKVSIWFVLIPKNVWLCDLWLSHKSVTVICNIMSKI